MEDKFEGIVDYERLDKALADEITVSGDAATQDAEGEQTCGSSSANFQLHEEEEDKDYSLHVSHIRERLREMGKLLLNL